MTTRNRDGIEGEARGQRRKKTTREVGRRSWGTGKAGERIRCVYAILRTTSATSANKHATMALSTQLGGPPPTTPPLETCARLTPGGSAGSWTIRSGGAVLLLLLIVVAVAVAVGCG